MTKPRVSLVVNCDTRPGWLEPFTGIKDYGDNSLCGCRSVDFMLAGVRNKRTFFDGCDLETILVIDKREEIPAEVISALELMKMSGEITKLVIKKFDHALPRWNDRLYIESLRHTTFDYVAHFDGDAAAFRRPEFPFVEMCLQWLELEHGFKFVCQQTPLDESVHGMWWASTRFFICKRDTLNLDEAERCIDDKYRRSRWGAEHCPCFEHIISLISGRKVRYPPCDNDNFLLINWVHYYRSTLDKLNAMPYDEVRRIVFDEWGGPLGASDVIAKEIL